MEKSSLQEEMFLNLCTLNGWLFLYVHNPINIWSIFCFKLFT